MSNTNNFSITQLPKNQEDSNKTFLKDDLVLTGLEISQTVLLAGESSPFLHQHKQNEELYICLKGQGQFQVDGQCTDFLPETLVRVSPQGLRAVRNVGQDPLVYLCIQVKAGSLTQWTYDDGIRSEQLMTWPEPVAKT